jgi:kynurenine formamidase
LVPLDYDQAGQIRDDDLFTTLVGKMAKGVQLTCVMDCCHSGTVLDLPFHFVADGAHDQMEATPEFDFGPFLQMAQQWAGDSAADEAVTQAMAKCGACTIL